MQCWLTEIVFLSNFPKLVKKLFCLTRTFRYQLPYIGKTKTVAINILGLGQDNLGSKKGDETKEEQRWCFHDGNADGIDYCTSLTLFVSYEHLNINNNQFIRLEWKMIKIYQHFANIWKMCKACKNAINIICLNIQLFLQFICVDFLLIQIINILVGFFNPGQNTHAVVVQFPLDNKTGYRISNAKFEIIIK